MVLITQFPTSLVIDLSLYIQPRGLGFRVEGLRFFYLSMIVLARTGNCCKPFLVGHA